MFNFLCWIKTLKKHKVFQRSSFSTHLCPLLGHWLSRISTDLLPLKLRKESPTIPNPNHPEFFLKNPHNLGGGFKYVLFSPRTLGKMNPLWPAYVLKTGCFNYQLAMASSWFGSLASSWCRFRSPLTAGCMKPVITLLQIWILYVFSDISDWQGWHLWFFWWVFTMVVVSLMFVFFSKFAFFGGWVNRHLRHLPKALLVLYENESCEVSGWSWGITLPGTNISHLWKRKIIVPATFKGEYVIVPWRVSWD